MVGEAKSDARLYISGSAADVVASFQAGENSKLVLQQLFFYMAANNLTCGFVTSSVRTYLVRNCKSAIRSSWEVPATCT